MVQLICNEKQIRSKKRTFDIKRAGLEFLPLTTELYTHIPYILIVKLHSFQRLMDTVGEKQVDCPK